MFYYLIFIIPGLLLALFAKWRVNVAFNKYSQVRNLRGLTGAQVARAMLDAEGLHHVPVEPAQGILSDHYDPRSRTLRLSETVYGVPSVAAAGIAAHEMGHALQHAQSYAPLGLRSALVPAVQIGSNLGSWLIVGGLILEAFMRSMGGGIGFYIAVVGLFLFASTAVFALVTLPVEIDASRRAKKLLTAQGILRQEEMEGVNRVLDAAAWTYVAAAVQAILSVAYYAFLLFGRRRD